MAKSGGGNKGSGGSGGGNKGGGGSPARTAAPSAPAPTFSRAAAVVSKPAATVSKPAAAVSKPAAAVNKPSTTTATPQRQTSTPQRQTPAAGRNTSQDNRQGRQDNRQDSKKSVQERTQEAKTAARAAISSASSTGIADPDAYKKALDRLKKLDKDKAVKTTRSERQAASRAYVAPQTIIDDGTKKDDETTNLPDAPPAPGITKEELDRYLSEFGSTLGGTVSTQINDIFSQYKPQTQPEQTQPTQPSDEGSSFEETYSKDLETFLGNLSSQQNTWLQDYSAEQTKRQEQYAADQERARSDYQSMLAEVGTKEGAFDPDLFRSLLGELESSKRRQKDWNELSAKAAYKY